MNFIVSFFLKFFTGGVLDFVSKTITQLSNEHVAIVQAQTGLQQTEVGGVVAAEQSRIAALAATQTAAMNHRIWWISWALFAVPAGLYSALVHAKSIMCPFYENACHWNIMAVPSQFATWDTYVVLGFFGLAATSSAITSIANRIGK
jgi:hypothetical protein